MFLVLKNREDADPNASTGVVAAGPSTNAAADTRPNGWLVLGSLAAVGVVALVAYYLVWKEGVDKTVFTPRSDYVALAGVILLATGLERLLEPVSGYLLPAADKEAAATQTAAAAVNAANSPAADAAEVTEKAKDAADADAALAKRKNDRKVLFWAIATALALLACAAMGVFLIGTIAAEGSQPNRLLDLLITGLVIGGGTKPTHDLITKLSKPAPTPAAVASDTSPAG